MFASKARIALDTLLTSYSDAISAKTYNEPISLINDAHLQMDLALTLAGVAVDEPLPPSGDQYLYLPLVRR
jgi:hypothetical protein